MSEIHRHEDYKAKTEYHADVVIVGTGAGGAAAGKVLAEAGIDVLFVEEGGWHPTESFNGHSTESIPRLYRDASATVIMGKPPIPYVEGRCVGGSTVINGGMTWRTPDNILAEWAKITGSVDMGKSGLDPLFDHVEGLVSAKPQMDLSIGEDNRLMARGAKKMGWEYLVNKRNQDQCVGSNNCVFGCPTGAKQSALVSLMPHAMGAGARCLTEVRVQKLLIKNGRCVGVVGRAMNPRTRRLDKEVTIHANAVIIACGAVQTPYLLLKHRLGRPSKQLGRNFLCHPNAKVVAVYPHEVRGWQGVSQWTQIRHFHDEGILFAENFVPPAALAAHVPFHGQEAWDLMQDYNRIVVSGVLVEDSTTGRVSRAPFGMSLVRYNLTKYDHYRFLKGIRLLAQMHFEMGAERVMLPFNNFFMAHSIDELSKIEESQKNIGTLEPFTVHLMGTARMGADAKDSVVDLNGQLWDLPGCYVADGSLFPTAIAVNPQITIMALATRVARRLVESRKARSAA